MPKRYDRALHITNMRIENEKALMAGLVNQDRVRAQEINNRKVAIRFEQDRMTVDGNGNAAHVWQQDQKRRIGDAEQDRARLAVETDESRERLIAQYARQKALETIRQRKLDKIAAERARKLQSQMDDRALADWMRSGGGR